MRQLLDWTGTHPWDYSNGTREEMKGGLVRSDPLPEGDRLWRESVICLSDRVIMSFRFFEEQPSIDYTEDDLAAMAEGCPPTTATRPRRAAEWLFRHKDIWVSSSSFEEGFHRMSEHLREMAKGYSEISEALGRRERQEEV